MVAPICTMKVGGPILKCGRLDRWTKWSPGQYNHMKYLISEEAKSSCRWQKNLYWASIEFLLDNWALVYTPKTLPFGSSKTYSTGYTERFFGPTVRAGVIFQRTRTSHLRLFQIALVLMRNKSVPWTRITLPSIISAKYSKDFYFKDHKRDCN